MSKRGGFPGGMGGFGGMNINGLMKQAKKMQEDLEKSQTELAAKEFEASAGGSAVTVKVNLDNEDNSDIKNIIKKCTNINSIKSRYNCVDDLLDDINNIKY